MTIFYRHRAEGAPSNVVTLRVFSVPDGIGCVVSWPTPEPGLRVFTPTPSRPEGVTLALPYALFMSQRLGGIRPIVELDDGIEWQPAWGELREWHD